MTAVQLGNWQNSLFATNSVNFTITQPANAGRCLVMFGCAINDTDTLATPTYNGVAPTFVSKRSLTDEGTTTWSYITVAVWMNTALPALAGTYALGFSGAAFEKHLSVCEFSGVSPVTALRAVDITNTRGTALTLSLSSVIANSLNFAYFSINPGYSAEWVNANNDTVIFNPQTGYALYCKPFLLSRHGATGTLNFSPTNAGTGDADSWTNWPHAALLSLQPRDAGTVNGGNPIVNGQTVVSVTSPGFTAAATMTLVNGSSSQSQSFTFVSSGVFTINTINQGSLPFGPAFLRITEGLETESIPVVIRTVVDNAYTNISNHNTTIDSIFYNYAPYATITQVEYTEADLVYEPKRDKVLTQKTTIYPDGTFRVFRDLPSFQVRLHDGTDWSPSFATISLNSFDNLAPPTWPKTCRSSSHMSLWEKCTDLHPYKYNRSIYSKPSFPTPSSRPDLSIRKLVRNLGNQRYAKKTLPTKEFYQAFRDGVQLKLFEVSHLLNKKQQAEILIEVPVVEGDVTRHEWKFRIDSDFTIGENALIDGRNPRTYTHNVGQFYPTLETDFGQSSTNFIEEAPPTRMNLCIVNNQYYMQPYHSFAPIRDVKNWIKFKQNEWVGVIVLTRWSRHYGGWHAIYINGQLLFSSNGGCLPTSSEIYFKLGLTAANIALSRRSISFKEAELIVNPSTLLP